MAVPKIRTLDEAIKELKASDPGTCVTKHFLWTSVRSGVLPHIRAGGKYLVNMDVLADFLTNPPERAEIHRIG